VTTIKEVLDGLAESIQHQAGLRTMPLLSSTIPHPCAMIASGPYDPRMVLGRTKAAYPFTVTVYVGPASERSAQEKCHRLREAFGAESVVSAVESLPDFVAGVDYGTVTEVGEITLTIVAEETLMTIKFEIEVVF
jgi:hypothetical protein